MRPVMFLKTSNNMCLPGCKSVCFIYWRVVVVLFDCGCCLFVGRFTDAWLFFFFFLSGQWLTRFLGHSMTHAG